MISACPFKFSNGFRKYYFQMCKLKNEKKNMEVLIMYDQSFTNIAF